MQIVGELAYLTCCYSRVRDPIHLIVKSNEHNVSRSAVRSDRIGQILFISTSRSPPQNE